MLRADNLATFLCRFSRNSGSLDLPKPYGPVQACNGIDLQVQPVRLAGLVTLRHRVWLTLGLSDGPPRTVFINLCETAAR